jgi:hypothetical protein
MRIFICIHPFISLFFVLTIQTSWSQPSDTTMQDKKPEVVTFIEKFDAKMETKDGYYLNGYLVNIDREQARRLDGKKIRVKGIVTIIEGLESQQQELDSAGNPIMKQGRSKDIRFIADPGIEVVE